MHLGGDEVSFGCWQSNPNITAWMKENNVTRFSELIIFPISHQFLSYAKLEEIWVQKVIKITEKHKFDYVVWEEVFNNGIDINPEVSFFVHHFPFSNILHYRLLSRFGFHTILKVKLTMLPKLVTEHLYQHPGT